MNNKYLFSSVVWGVISKLFDAVIKFISVPILLTYFGKEQFGLIALATSVNAYLQLLDLGINLGAIKFFSEWISNSKYDLLSSAARTNLLFYGIIGLINASILILVAFFGVSVFSIEPQYTGILRSLFLILACFVVINWISTVFNQLLTANQEINYIQKFNLIRTVANLLIIFITMWLNRGIEFYFFMFCLANSFTVIPFYLRAKKNGLISSFLPKADIKTFKIILRYSLAIIAMGIFQLSATKLRPIILGIFSDDAINILADYRILETITLFIISIGGMFISILLPMTSKLMVNKDHKQIEQFAYRTTLFTTIVCVLLCMPFLISGKKILEIYVGLEYIGLYKWLVLWVVTILFYLHNSPISSLVLATGKTRMLVISSAISCIISLFINAIYCNFLGVGSAVVGYSVYIVIQMSFYYFYFNNKVLKLNSWKVFKSFIVPASIGLLSAILVYAIKWSYKQSYLEILVKISTWAVLYFLLLFVFRVIRKADLTDFKIR